jgi:hypothetical protein
MQRSGSRSARNSRGHKVTPRSTAKQKTPFWASFLGCGGWTRTSDLQVMSYKPDSASYDPNLAFLTGFRTFDANEPEEL